MSQKIAHWELMGPDAEKLATFYRGLFGWQTTTPPGFDDYHLVDAEQTGIGGAIGRGSEQMPSYVTVYFEVPDIDTYLAKAEENGGNTVLPRTVLPEMVTFALFSDPAGNVVGLVEPGMPPAE